MPKRVIDFKWPATGFEIPGLMGFSAEYEEYTAYQYKLSIESKVNALINMVHEADAERDKLQAELDLIKGRTINTSDPVNDRLKFEAYAREKGLDVSVVLMLMSNPPQFKEYANAEAQAAWLHWQDIRAR